MLPNYAIKATTTKKHMTLKQQIKYLEESNDSLKNENETLRKRSEELLGLAYDRVDNYSNRQLWKFIAKEKEEIANKLEYERDLEIAEKMRLMDIVKMLINPKILKPNSDYKIRTNNRDYELPSQMR